MKKSREQKMANNRNHNARFNRLKFLALAANMAMMSYGMNFSNEGRACYSSPIFFPKKSKNYYKRKRLASL